MPMLRYGIIGYPIGVLSVLSVLRREDLKPSGWHWPKRIALVAIILMTLGAGCVAFLLPTVAAYACPRCYGLQRVTGGLFVDPVMSVEDRADLQGAVSQAAAQVAAFYGSFDRRPRLLACATKECDHRLGGKGAKAETYGTLFIRLSADGLNRTILAHEFSHVELHARIGLSQFAAGVIAAWFDEGLAVIVSDDVRYLKPGVTSAARCSAEPAEDLPTTPYEWGSLAGKTHELYAQAACRVMKWMEANGGKAGLLAAISQVADGTRQLP